MFQVEFHVAGNEKVQLAVAVVIAEGRSGGPDRCCSAHGNASLLGDIRESAIAIVAVEPVLAEVGDV